jgi:hypothetical protein
MAAPADTAAPEPAVARSGGRRVLVGVRVVAAALAATLGVLCLVLAPVTIWARNLVLNTDRYVSTVSPLASNPGVQDAVIAAVDRQVETHIDVQSLVGSVLPPDAAKVLGAPVQNAVYGLIHNVTSDFVHSKAFQNLWTGINRAAHTQIVNLLTGKKSSLRVRAGQVVLDLSPVVQNVQARLVSAGLAVASQVPPVGATLEIAQLKGVTKAQKLVRALNTIADWLPWIGLVLIAAGVTLARRHRRALMRSLIGLGAGMIVLGIGLAIGRHIYLNNIPTTALPRSTAASIFDTLVRYLRWGIRGVFLVALLVILGLWVSGPSRSALAVRRWVAEVWGRLTRYIRTPVAPFVARNANAFRIAIVAVVGLALLFAQAPSLTTFIVALVIVVLLLAAVEGLRRLATREEAVVVTVP